MKLERNTQAMFAVWNLRIAVARVSGHTSEKDHGGMMIKPKKARRQGEEGLWI